MKAEVKGWQKRVDLRDRCGRIDLRAEDDHDALVLARLARLLFYGTPEDRQRLEKFLLPN